MARLTFRASPELLARLDGFADARGLADRSEAVRVAVMEAVMTPEQRRTIPDRQEVLELLAAAAREGSVTAMRTLLEEQRRDGDDTETKPTSVIDELAQRRTA